jgi:4-hydroxy 2-oxovalerate aldolase
VGNEGHRLEEVFQGSNIKGKCILPPYPREMGTYVPKSLTENSFELESVEFTDLYRDSHTALALQSILALKIEKVFMTGYDGYSGNHIGEKEQELFLENQHLFSKIKGHFNIQLVSLTPTKYTELKGDSVYSKI